VTNPTAARSLDGDSALARLDRLEALPPGERTAEDESHLVELRHLAFAELDRRPGRDRWPVDLPDPFPGLTGLPEIERGALTADVLGGALVHHGCLRVNGLLDAERAARLRTLIATAHDARERIAEGEPPRPGDDAYAPFAVGREKAEGFGRAAFVRVVDVPQALRELVDAFTESGVRDAVAGYFNERPAMIANKWGLRRTVPAESRCADFHQDGAFLGEGIRTVDGWISLSHCGPGTGAPGIEFVARRFDGVLPAGEGSVFPWSLSEATVLAAADDAPVVSPVLAPGDALFFDERLVHRTSVGPDTDVRYAVESWFVAPSSYPDKHVPVVL